MFSRGRPWTVLLLAIILALYALNHGVYIGANDQLAAGASVKSCRYFYLSGIVELPAQPIKQDDNAIKNANATRCKFFAE